jgi:hypothetical protein
MVLVLLGACNASLLGGIGGDNGPEPTLATKLRGIWVVGGAANLDGTGICSQLDLYDPAANTWYPDVAAGATGSYVPTIHNMVASVNGRIYVLGGASNNSTVVSSVYEYDIAENRWSTKANILVGSTPTALMASAVYTHGGCIYLIGGTNTTTTAGVQTVHLKFDPASGASGQWTTLAAYTTARASMGAGCMAGSACFFGGRINTGAGQSTNDMYIIASNSYTAQTETAIQARAGAAYATHSSINGTYVFIVGGAPTFAAATAYFTPLLTAITYVAQAQSFQIYVPPATGGAPTNARPHPAFTGGNTGIVFASAAVSPYNGTSTEDPTLYVLGGISTGLAVTSEVWAMDADETLGSYSPTGLSWVSKGNMPRERYGHGVTTVNP